ncbi:MAG: ATP-binding cassette domain-containing protein [Acidimicrobiia bacterium]|nr:ATP-binding cassette domain-containing protein [Acidimicrobiia bacterium]
MTEEGFRQRHPLISIRNVSKVYESRTGPLHAVDRVTFDVTDGEFVSVVGPSGCGKSTLLMMIAGLFAATEGTLEIGGTRVTEPYTDIGIVFQQDLLMDWRDVMGNVLIQAELRRLRSADYIDTAKDLLASVGLAGFEDKYPFELSGGMRQRVALCRALVHDPKVLLMDEPFGALDALTRERMTYDLQRIWQASEKTVVFITHSIAEAVFLSNRIVVMSPRPGQIVEIIDVPIPRPRVIETQESAAYGRIVTRIHHLFRDMGVFT